MKEVFEKIIAQLKIEVKRWEDSGTEYKDKCEIAIGRGLRKAIEIVKKEAEKYNNGWIPCSERLPEEHDSMFKRFKETDRWRDFMFEKTSNEVTVTIADERGEKVTTHAHTTDGTWKCDILRAYSTYRVIAWQPFPTPYQPHKREEKK